MQNWETSLITVSDCTRDRQHTDGLPLTARLLALVILHHNTVGVLLSIITILNAEEKTYSAIFLRHRGRETLVWVATKTNRNVKGWLTHAGRAETYRHTHLPTHTWELSIPITDIDKFPAPVNGLLTQINGRCFRLWLLHVWLAHYTKSATRKKKKNSKKTHAPTRQHNLLLNENVIVAWMRLSEWGCLFLSFEKLIVTVALKSLLWHFVAMNQFQRDCQLF